MNNDQGLSWFSQPLQQHQQGLGDAGETGEGTVSNEGQGESQPSEYASQFLGNVPEEHRSVLEPYVKQWDAGVTRRFQDLHSQYQPYKDAGWDVDTFAQVQEIVRVLNEEPERLYQALHEEYGQKQVEAQNLGEGTGPSLQGEVPTEFQTKFDQMQSVVETMAQFILQQQQGAQESQEDQELDNYLGLLKQEFGDFDEDYVLTKMANGVDGEQAVRAWQGLIQERINESHKATGSLLPTLSSNGGGAVPVGEAQKLGQIPEKDLRALVANVIGQANQAAQ